MVPEHHQQCDDADIGPFANLARNKRTCAIHVGGEPCNGGQTIDQRYDSWRSMLNHFPQAVPEIPVSSVEKAAEYYVNVLGFRFDWGDDDGGIGGISQGDCRMFLTNAPFRAAQGSKSPVVIWLNLNSKQEVDELFERWKGDGAKIVAAVEDQPYNLREFRVADLDGNQLRVFYDFNWEMSENRRLERRRR